MSSDCDAAAIWVKVYSRDLALNDASPQQWQRMNQHLIPPCAATQNSTRKRLGAYTTTFDEALT